MKAVAVLLGGPPRWECLYIIHRHGITRSTCGAERPRGQTGPRLKQQPTDRHGYAADNIQISIVLAVGSTFFSLALGFFLPWHDLLGMSDGGRRLDKENDSSRLRKLVISEILT